MYIKIHMYGRAVVVCILCASGKYCPRMKDEPPPLWKCCSLRQAVYCFHYVVSVCFSLSLAYFRHFAIPSLPLQQRRICPSGERASPLSRLYIIIQPLCKRVLRTLLFWSGDCGIPAENDFAATLVDVFLHICADFQ